MHTAAAHIDVWQAASQSQPVEGEEGGIQPEVGSSCGRSAEPQGLEAVDSKCLIPTLTTCEPGLPAH
jgi:hypothetical protein